MERSPMRTRLGSISTDTQIEVNSLSPDNKRSVLNSIVDSFSKIGIAQYEGDVVNLLEMMHYFSQDLYIDNGEGPRDNQDRRMFSDNVRISHNSVIKRLREYVSTVFPQMSSIEQSDSKHIIFEHKSFVIKKIDDTVEFNLNIEKQIAEGQYSIIYKGIIDKKECVVRVQQPSTDSADFILINSVKEAVIHTYLSLLESRLLTEGESNQRGVVPIILVAVINGSIITVLDKLDGDCFYLINTKNESDKALVFKDILKQVICYNSLLYKLCKFNHHDLKINNIFYRTHEDHNEFFLADFGMSRIVVTYGDKHYNIICVPLNFTNQLPSSKSYDIMVLLISSMIVIPSICTYIFDTILSKLNINLQIDNKYNRHDMTAKIKWAYYLLLDRSFTIYVSHWHTLYTPEMFLFIRHHFDHIDFSEVFGFSSTCEGITKFNVRGFRPSSATLTPLALPYSETIPATEVHRPIAERRIVSITPISPIHEGGNQQKTVYRFIMK